MFKELGILHNEINSIRFECEACNEGNKTNSRNSKSSKNASKGFKIYKSLYELKKHYEK